MAPRRKRWSRDGSEPVEMRLIVGYGVLLVLVLSAVALALQYYFSRRARYRERWRIDDEKLPPGWWNRR